MILRITAVFLTLASFSFAAEPVDFGRDIRPILSDKCFTCHGPDENTREAGLRLDQAAGLTAKLESGEVAVVPGDPVASELVRRITSDDEFERMPPEEGKPLSAKEIELLKRWVAEGAKYEQHWSFLPPKRPELPAVKQTSWVRHPIDRLVLAKLEANGMTPSPEASKETLIRRVSYDLTGLPPTLEEIDAFLADTSPAAYENMVDRYLASPAYGEKMAKHWLDLARYADTNGYQYDTERQQWVWRDWVIDAYNRNMPFDQFTIEQIAGDLLPNATPQQRLATAFNRNHGITIEGGVIDEEYRVEYVMDRVNTTGAAWLGLTVGCARCHDHKYDPLSQKEFYQLYAYFNQVPEKGNQGFDPREQIASPLSADGSLDEELQQLRQKLAIAQSQAGEKSQVWAQRTASEAAPSWNILNPAKATASGGVTLARQPDLSLLAAGANPAHTSYIIETATDLTGITAVRLEALLDQSLPGGGPGRYGNSNFVISEFELEAISVADPAKKQTIKFSRATADYSQQNYEVAKLIDGTSGGTNGWAVDGPTRKEPSTAILVAEEPFGFSGGTTLRFTLEHASKWPQHAIGRPRLSITCGDPARLASGGLPENILSLAKKAGRSPAEEKELADYYFNHISPEKQQIEQQIAALQGRKAEKVPTTMIMRDLPTPRKTFLLDRGMYNARGAEVSPGVPAVLPPLPENAPANRLGFAMWLVDAGNPLTARVAVNRYWYHLFGTGLVKTMEDYGLQGELPSHPALLDWLAVEFVESGWNIKGIQKQILLSATYRQSSEVSAKAYQADPENRLLARGPRMRLEAEEIRDMALATSGLLVKRLGGPSVYPYQPDGLWMELNNRPGYSKEYQVGTGDDLYRRSMYTFWKRTVPSPMMISFDAPEREFCTVRRSRTNTPLQSLLLLNGPQFVEAARKMAERTMKEGGEQATDQIAYVFRLATGRRPTEQEQTLLLRYRAERFTHYRTEQGAADKLLAVGKSPADPALDPASLAAWADVCRLILNLDETITKE